MRGSKTGQVLVGVIIIMVIMAIFIPVMVLYVQNESRWTIKQQRNMIAFQLAEAAVDRGYRKISESTGTWYTAQEGGAGAIPTGYLFDIEYSDLSGGTYAIAISSGPEEEQATIFGIGRDTSGKEVRTVRAIYSNSPMGETAVRSGGGVTITGSNVVVHWGAIVTPKDIDSQGRLFPQMWSAGLIDLDGTTPTSKPPNCDQPDCCQWHSYAEIPPDPGIDPNYFKIRAQADEASSGLPHYFNGDETWGNSGPCYDDADCDTGEYYYIEGDLTVTKKFFIRGALAITGNLILPSGNVGGKSNYDVPLPDTAWMHYCLDWAEYRDHMDDGGPPQVWDTSAPTDFPGITANYRPDAGQTVRLDKVLIDGFLWVAGNLTQAGGAGGNSIVGAIYVGGSVSLGANVIKIYYQKAAGEWIRTTKIILTRESWRDLPGKPFPM